MKKITFLFLAWIFLPNFINAQCAITSAPTNNCTFGDGIQSFMLNGIPAVGNGGCGGGGYNSFASPVWTLQIGSTYTWSSAVGGGYYDQGFAIWIDLNNDGFYNSTNEFVASSIPAATHSGSITIPLSATLGVPLRMRIRDALGATILGTQACANGIGGGYGETEDYFIYLVCPAVTPTVSVAASSTLLCSGNPATLTASGLSTYTWSGGVSNGVGFTPATTTNYTVTAGIAGCPSNTRTAVATISVNATPTITGITSGSICPGISFVMTPGGATTYSYANGSTTLTGASLTVAPVSITSYTVSGSANGCLSKVSTAGYATVTPLAAPVIAVSASSSSVCPNITTTVSASGANTYTWTSPSSNAQSINVNPTVTTIYTVAGTGTNICISNKTFTLFVYPSPTITVNSNTICAGKIFTMVPSGAATYTFSNGSNTISPTTNTTINVVGASANGCLSNPVVAGVTVVALPVVTVSSSTLCSGSQLFLTPTGATNYTYVGFSNPISPTVSTSYTIIGTNSSGCISLPAVSDVTVFAKPVLSVAATPSNMVICNNDLLTLTASGAVTYTWNNVTSGSTFTSAPSTSSNHFVVGTDANGCTDFVITAYTVNPLPTVSVNGNTFLCLGNSSTLVAVGASSYSWTNASTSNPIVVNPSVTTVYGVTGTNAFGCNNTASISVQVNTIQIIASSNTAICIGNTVIISAVGATNYTWSPGSSPFSSIPVSPSVTTTYSYLAVDANQCSHNGIISVTVNPIPVITALGSDSLICAGETATMTASGGSTYVWTVFGSNVGTGATLVVTPNFPTIYSVKGTDSNGCSSTGTVSIEVDRCTGLITAKNDLSGLSIYPNPTKGEFTIDLDNGLVKKIQVMDVAGRVVVSTQSKETKTVIDLNDISNGVYYVKIESNNSSNVIKVIKN